MSIIPYRIKSVFRHPRWNVAVARMSREAFFANPDFGAFEWYGHLAADEFAADPFLIEHDGKPYLFYEHLSYRTNRGEIWVSSISADGGIEPGKPALVQDFHLSYPFLIEHEGTLYMIPESFEQGEVALYRCDSFPYAWSRTEALLPDVAGLDATVLQHDGLWWMFAMPYSEPQDYSLRLWYAEDLLGEWRAHPMNPIVSGAAVARPGGNVYSEGGVLYRPSQDCAGRYGGQLVINEIVTLTPDHYEERVARVIAPDARSRYRYGLHTINTCGEWLTIDACRENFVPREAKRALRSLFGRSG